MSGPTRPWVASKCPGCWRPGLPHGRPPPDAALIDRRVRGIDRRGGGTVGLPGGGPSKRISPRSHPGPRRSSRRSRPPIHAFRRGERPGESGVIPGNSWVAASSPRTRSEIRPPRIGGPDLGRDRPGSGGGRRPVPARAEGARATAGRIATRGDGVGRRPPRRRRSGRLLGVLRPASPTRTAHDLAIHRGSDDVDAISAASGWRRRSGPPPRRPPRVPASWISRTAGRRSTWMAAWSDSMAAAPIADIAGRRPVACPGHVRGVRHDPVHARVRDFRPGHHEAALCAPLAGLRLVVLVHGRLVAR